MVIGVLREQRALRRRRRGWWATAYKRAPLTALPWLPLRCFGFGGGWVLPAEPQP